MGVSPPCRSYHKELFSHSSIFISILVTANQENNLDDQGGEEVVNNTTNGLQYLRTSWRVVIVKDTQSNRTDPQITWDQVFTSGVVKTNEEVGGINSELNIGNMGRFIIRVLLPLLKMKL